MKEISAEMLLGYYYPELSKVWKVNAMGTFYRNYSDDVMTLDTESGELSLARDGFLRLLPDAMISHPDELRGSGFAKNYESVKLRKQILKEAFVPYDTFNFRNKLRIERKVSQLLDSKLAYILQKYFMFDIENEQNEYVKEVATMLPFISKRRGDLPFIAELLKALYGCDVETDMSHRHSKTDSTVQWMPMVIYNIIMKGLTSKEYLCEVEKLKPLAKFIKEWFIPIDVKCRIEIKQHGINPSIDGLLVLDYNTEL